MPTPTDIRRAGLIFLAAFFCGYAPAHSVPKTWRALIVYTEPLNNQCLYPGGWNWYEGDPACPGCCTTFSESISDVNLVYERSGLTDTAEIAGVIKDLTHYRSHGSGCPGGVGGSGVEDLDSLSGPLGRYIDLLPKYAADALILVDTIYSDGFAGCSEVENPTDYARIWVGHLGGWVWAHEMGHQRDLMHCNGYRRSYDSTGAPVTSGAKRGWGFNTVMEYEGGASECIFNGDHSDVTRESMTFSDTNLTWWNDSTGRTEVLGAAPDNIDRPKHAANEDIIPAHINTPDNLTIADTMSLSRFDFADFLSFGTVTINPGFNLAAGAKMSITVGSSALSKRSAETNQKFISGNDSLPQKMGRISDFTSTYDPFSMTMKISFRGDAGSNVSLAVYDIKGVKKGSFGEFESDGDLFSKVISLARLPSGAYFFGVAVGDQKIYKQFSKR